MSKEVSPRIVIWILAAIGIGCAVTFILALRAIVQRPPEPAVTVIIPANSGASQEMPPKLFFREGFPTQEPAVVKLEVQDYKTANDSPKYQVSIYARLRREIKPNQPPLTPSCDVDADSVRSCAAVLNSPNEDVPGIKYDEGWVFLDTCDINQDCQWDIPVPFDKQMIREVRAYLVRQP
ncbi:MAG: hypothetical protein WC675_05080 [Patescibacteria group bacterium]|jgi:hypothetical protein